MEEKEKIEKIGEEPKNFEEYFLFKIKKLEEENASLKEEILLYKISLGKFSRLKGILKEYGRYDFLPEEIKEKKKNDPAFDQWKGFDIEFDSLGFRAYELKEEDEMTVKGKKSIDDFSVLAGYCQRNKHDEKE